MQTSHLATSAGMVASEGSGHLRSSDDHRAAPAANSYVMSTTTLTTPQRSIPKAPGRTSLHSALHPPPPPPPSSTVDPTRAADQSPSTFGKQAAQSITPFLTKHIPTQYAPLGAPNHSDSGNKNSNTKYCYRHRPDLKCRRQANEPSMDQLQKELATLPESDQQGISHVWSLFSAAPSKHRNLMLQGILAQCCFPQLSAVSASVRDLIKIDFLSALPSELGLKVLCYLDPTSICKAAQVSERWRTLADDDVVWHRMCEQHIDRKCVKCGWGLPLLDRKRLRTEKRQIQLRAEGRHVDEEIHETVEEMSGSETVESVETGPSSISEMAEANTGMKRTAGQSSLSPVMVKRACLGIKGGSPELRDHEDPYFKTRLQPWKDVYRDRFRIGTNWKYGRCSIRTFKGHTNGVMCLQFDDNILASGSYDATIKIWDIESGKELRTLSGHTSGIRCLQFDEHKLMSGSLDGTLKMWDLNTGKLVRTLTGHTGGVISLHFEGTTIVSGSQDNTVNVWDFKSCSRYVLRGHTDWVNAVKLDLASRTLFSASDDCTIRLWDLDTKQCIKVFDGHVGQVQQVIPLPAEFDIVDMDESEGSGSNSQWATEFLNGGDSDRAAPPRYMLTGALDTTIRLWDVHTGRCLKTFFGHVEGIWALAADTLRVVSGAEDRMVKIWDPRTGTCERTFTGHSGPVTCVGLSDRRMCTGSEDHEIRLYTF